MNEIDSKIQNYWAVKYQTLTDSEQQLLEAMLTQLEKCVFVKPDKDHPVRAVEFAACLNVEPLLPFFDNPAIYKDFKKIAPRLPPRIRFFIYYLLSRQTSILAAYREFSEEDAKMLGFDKKPTYEMVREFMNERIGVERFPELFRLVITTIREEAEKRGIQIGERIAEDATDIRALKHDKEAKYSGYYKEFGYKSDVVHDLEHQDLVLYYRPMEITADEGQNLPYAQEELLALGIKPKEWFADTKYATYENIACSEIRGIHLKYKIPKGWKYNKKGEEQEIKRIYQKYHNAPDFVPGASIEYQLKYLYERGEIEAVGAYFRNKRMEMDSEMIREEMGERSGKTEGCIGRMKTCTILDRRPARRGWKEIERICGLTFLAHAFAALICLQHGVTENLGNITYII